MKGSISKLGLAAFLILMGCQLASASDFKIGVLPDGAKYFTNKIIIMNERDALPYKCGITESGFAYSGVSSVDDLCRSHSVIRIEPFYPGRLHSPALSALASRLYVFTLAAGVDSRQFLDHFTADPNIQFAELYSAPEPCYVPNDPDAIDQWYLGQVSAYQGWDIVRGDTTRHAVIGIVDTGVHWDHPDLTANIWINAAEDANHNGIFDHGDNDGIDADSNGYIDDVAGWDLGDNDNNPIDDVLPHGTPVAGCASEVTDNDLDGAAIGFWARIMAVKGCNSSGVLSAVWQGIIYAADNGADIINCSWGSMTYSQAEQNIINAITSMDVLVIASAGAQGGTTPNYPAAYDNVLAVGATDQNDHLVAFSGYGAWVEVCAPGVDIWTTYGPSDFIVYSGTSFSTAMVSGLAALVRSWRPELTVNEVESLIVASADNIDSLNSGCPDSLVPPRLNCYNWLHTTSIAGPNIPEKFLLLQNAPNPFNSATTINYVLPAALHVKIVIYDIMGRKLETLIDSPQEPGSHSVSWSSNESSSGIYFYRIDTGDISVTRPMVLLK